MKTKFYILLLIINLTALAQNLVPNPSFENYSNCPSNQSQITYAIPWENHNNSGTPSDYLNSCATNPGYSTPSNWGNSYQVPATGNAYISLFAWFYSTHEMIGAPLISPLVAGTKYYVSLKVSPIISTSLAATHVISGLGAKFSTINFNSSNNDSLINNFAHVYSNQIISDSLNWTTISDSLIADSAYNYIFIGNFFDSNHFDTMQVAPTLVTTWFTAIGSFYYIDGI